MGTERENLRIVEAAVLYDGKIYTGKRHGKIMQDIWGVYPEAKILQEHQGFIASDGKFYNRFQAGAIAFAAGQTKDRKQSLISEHVW